MSKDNAPKAVKMFSYRCTYAGREGTAYLILDVVAVAHSNGHPHDLSVGEKTWDEADTRRKAHHQSASQ